MKDCNGFEFTVPMVPPGVNNYVKHTRAGRHYLTDETETFKDELALALQKRRCVGLSFSVILHVVLGKGQKGDVDNFAKLPLDALAHNAAFVNPKGETLSDAHINELIVSVDRKSRPDKGFTKISVLATS